MTEITRSEHVTPLNILQLITLDGWSAGSWYAIEFSRELQNRGHRTELHTSAEGETSVRARERNLLVATEINFKTSNPVVMVRNIVRLVKLLRTSRFSLMVSHWPQDHVYAAIANLFLRPRVPLLRVIAHDVRKPKVHPLNTLLHGKLTKGFVFSNERLKAMYVDRLGLDRKRAFIIPGGLNLKEFENLPCEPRVRKGLNIKEHATVIGMVARFSSVKGHQHFFKAAEIVARKRSDVSFIVAGYGNDIPLSALKGMAEKHGLGDRIAIVKDAAEVKSILSTLDISVVASVGSEAISRVILELMALKKPVVATAVGCISELVADGETGFVVPPANPELMAEALMKLLSDQALRQRMGENARKRLETHFRIEDLAEKMEQALRTVAR